MTNPNHWSAEIDKVAFEVCLDHNRDVDVVRVADVLALLKRVEAETWNDAIATALAHCRSETPGLPWTQTELVALKKCLANIRELLRPETTKKGTADE